MDKLDKNLFHNDSLQMFNDKMFEGILSLDHKISKKIAITLDKEKFYGFFFEKGSEMYFLEDIYNGDASVLETLPIRVKTKTEHDYNKKVFWFIDKFKSIKIPEEKVISLRKLVDTMAAFKHTNPIH